MEGSIFRGINDFSGLGSGVSLGHDEPGICWIGIHAPLSTETDRAVLSRVEQSCQSPRVLLDLRSHAAVSMVGLARLMDALTRPERRIAALLSSAHQQQTAWLLRNTLVHKERVDFFLEPEEALAFLR